MWGGGAPFAAGTAFGRTGPFLEDLPMKIVALRFVSLLALTSLTSMAGCAASAEPTQQEEENAGQHDQALTSAGTIKGSLESPNREAMNGGKHRVGKDGVIKDSVPSPAEAAMAGGKDAIEGSVESPADVAQAGVTQLEGETGLTIPGE